MRSKSVSTPGFSYCEELVPHRIPGAFNAESLNFMVIAFSQYRVLHGNTLPRVKEGFNANAVDVLSFVSEG